MTARKFSPAEIEAYAAAYSAKFGKAMSYEDAEAYLVSASVAAAENAKADAEKKAWEDAGYVFTNDGNWVKREVYEADVAAADKAVADLMADPAFDELLATLSANTK
tara:strand:- start:114 stop:434 length:321 start_codon:yes stop_codon:yes gene_type:complete